MNEASLIARIEKMFERIDRESFRSSRKDQVDTTSWKESIINKANKKEYFTTISIYDFNESNMSTQASQDLCKVLIDWNMLENDILNCLASSTGMDISEQTIPTVIRKELQFEKDRQYDEEHSRRKSHIKKQVNVSKSIIFPPQSITFYFMTNNSHNQKLDDYPTFKGKWRKEPYPIREYTLIPTYTVTTTIPKDEAITIKEQLLTPLDGFLGQAYNYNDNALTEEWMTSFVTEDDKIQPSNEEVIRTQIEIIVEIMINKVQDRVCTESGYLQQPMLQLGSEVIEQPVWGIDVCTRRTVEIAIEDRLPELYDSNLCRQFIEGKLLPAINSQKPLQAHDMRYSLDYIIQNPKTSEIFKKYAEIIQNNIAQSNITKFRIHPKGTGVICNIPEGIRPHVVVTDYLGELYPPYRWCEKLDVIEQAQRAFKLKPTLPDFYNILLERPRNDPSGYGMIFVDASQKANMGSSCSHSCDPNCTSSVVARDGKLLIVLTTNRYVSFGEELCMDYCSITTSEIEWNEAICLCGMTTCRGSFLRYTTQDNLQQVFNSKCGPTVTFSSLLRSCASKPINEADRKVMKTHGMLTAALGTRPRPWMEKFTAELLRFVEFERKALPCALLRKNNENMYNYTFVGADGEARSVMEQRMQSLVCCCSLVNRVIDGLPTDQKSTPPLQSLSCTDAIQAVWNLMSNIPTAMETYLLGKGKGNGNGNGNTTTVTTGTGKGNKNVLKQRCDIEIVEKCISNINTLLEVVPIGWISLRELILNIRRELKPLVPLSSPTA
eukprot:gene10270-21427_t